VTDVPVTIKPVWTVLVVLLEVLVLFNRVGPRNDTAPAPVSTDSTVPIADWDGECRTKGECR
jgi:hypothetical protein